MNTGNKVPAIRFKEFSDAWEDKKIGNILTEVKRPIELNDKTFYQLVTVKRRNGGVVPRALIKGRDILVKTYFVINKGDYLISKRQVVHGANGIVPKNLDNAVVSNEYLVVTDNEDITTNFWTVISKRTEMHKMFFISSYGVDIEKLVFDVTDWKNRIITIPKLTEQNRITGYFKQLDTLISMHQKKHDKLLNLKKSLLKKMFPKQGEKEPEIRFKGFSGEWIYLSLDDASIVSTGFPFDSNDFDESGEYLVVTNGNIQNNLPIVDASIGNRIDVEENSKLNEYILDTGDILVTMDGTVGRVAKVLDKKQILAQRVGRLTAKWESEFLYQLLCRVEFFKTMTLISHGGTIKHISLNEIGSYKSFFPKDIEEQTKIGNFFKQLDELLNQHQVQLDKLNNIKQACLDKMFV